MRTFNDNSVDYAELISYPDCSYRAVMEILWRVLLIRSIFSKKRFMVPWFCPFGQRFTLQ